MGKKRKGGQPSDGGATTTRPHKRPEASTAGYTVDPALQPAPPRTEVSWWGAAGYERATTFGRLGEGLLENLLRLDYDTFVGDYWLRKPYVRLLSEEERAKVAGSPRHPVTMLSLSDCKKLTRRKGARYMNDVDVTRYRDGAKRALAKGTGPVDHRAVWDAFDNKGYSVRLVHPQQWHTPLYELCSVLEAHFGFPVGCASYLTPNEKQGYPPHYDDVEIFVVQLEGSKRWRLYDRPDRGTNATARNTTEITQEQLGAPLMEFVLRPGDVMYFPRGVVHQAVSDPGLHSLHLTFSTFQRHTFYDLAMACVDSAPRTAPKAAKDRGAIRALLEAEFKRPSVLHRDLPLDLYDHMVVGSPGAAWRRLESLLDVSSYGYRQDEYSRPLPGRVAEWLARPGVMEGGIDVLAQKYHELCLPPIGTSPNPDDAESADLDGDSVVRLRVPRSAWLVCPEGCPSFDRLESPAYRSEASLELSTNVMNGRLFVDAPSPRFEVVPFLARSVVTILEAGRGGVRVSDLHAVVEGTDEDGEDLLDLLDQLIAHHVVIVHETGEVW